MHKYCVSYDLMKEGKDYTGLIEAIRRFDNIKALYSMWFIKSVLSADQIYNLLKAHIDQNDNIIIVEIGNVANKQGQMPQFICDWLNS